jgi:hypothetical protein
VFLIDLNPNQEQKLKKKKRCEQEFRSFWEPGGYAEKLAEDL